MHQRRIRIKYEAGLWRAYAENNGKTTQRPHVMSRSLSRVCRILLRRRARYESHLFNTMGA